MIYSMDIQITGKARIFVNSDYTYRVSLSGLSEKTSVQLYSDDPVLSKVMITAGQPNYTWFVTGTPSIKAERHKAFNFARVKINLTLKRISKYHTTIDPEMSATTPPIHDVKLTSTSTNYSDQAFLNLHEYVLTLLRQDPPKIHN